MAVPEAAVSFLLENLSQVLVQKYNLANDVRENIVKLQRELEGLKGLMSDFSKYNHGSEYIKTTVNDIRTILNEAEDAVDTYILHASVQKSRNWVSKFFHNITDYPKVLLDLGKQIEDITIRVNEMNKGKVMNGLNALQHQAVVRLGQAAPESPKVEEENVIGFDGASKSVQILLTTGSETLEIISIVGMLGLGKTTLARKVFREPNVDYEYMVRAFVYVSKDYDKKEVLLKILNSFTKPSDEVNGMDEDRLERYLRKELEGKQYLVVMDDVWDPEDWEKFKDCFPKNSKRCRVLLTTRNEKVAKHTNASPNSLYKLDFLKMDECQQLLRWRVFRKDYCPEELREFEIKIAHKCDGLPLAVVVIAGILVNHPERVDWWMKVAESVENYIARDTEKAGKVIDVMYTHLPNHLKSCFLYLGVFREDYEIPVWKLIRLWISEGLIPVEDGGFCLEDTAELYLDELVYRNLVMVGQRRSNDKIKTCRMHDTLREFCKKEAGEEKFFQEIKKDNLHYFLSGNPSLDENRRLCINNASIMDYVSGTPTGKCVRSFLTFVKEETQVDAKNVSRIPKTFKLLRVLEIQSLIFSRFPVELCNLVLLKYIAISSNFSTLPPALSALYNLQTLIVKTSSPVLEIKVDVWKLPHFRHLHTDAAATLLSPVAKPKEDVWLGKNVQTLCTISTESCKKQVFDRTPQLKKLGICGNVTKLLEVNDGSSMFSHLRKLSSLENLKLLNGDINNKLYCLPPKSSFPPKLMKLTLKNTLLEWKDMSVLGQLDHLEVLKLKEYAFQGDWWNTDKGGFRRLIHLYIGQTDLTAWEASYDHFPKLKSLVLNSCAKLQAIPHGLAEIPSLQLVTLHCTNPKVASSARRLQVLKLEQANQSNKPSNFKLSVYPPDH